MKEYGRIGQKRWEGVFNEEFLPELSGIRGVKTYREMEMNITGLALLEYKR